MAHQFCTVQDEGRLRIVTINRPEVLNALHPMANEELSAVSTSSPQSRDLWVAIITGAGDKAFSAGNDLKYQASSGQDRQAAERRPKGFGGLRQPLRSRQAGDRRGERRRHGRRIRDRAGLRHHRRLRPGDLRPARAARRPAAGAGGMQRLPRMIPLKKAMGMMLTGRHVPAREGYELGFVTEVVPHAELMDGGAALGQR